MQNYEPKRRALLRGILASGASLILAACDRRPQTSTTEMQTGQSPTINGTQPNTSPRIAAAPPSPAQTQKVSKVIAHYQEQPKGDQKCATCANFIAESHTCKVVEGPISPEGWCIYWMKA